MLATIVKPDGKNGLSETQPATASPVDPTRTSEPSSAANPGSDPGPEVRRVAATQIRDPDRYEIIEEHGRGGLGRVSRAHDRELGRDVAIKELLSRGHVGEVRFLREALITARLEHPGIVPVHEAGRWPDGTPFYAMKLVSGRPLRDLIAERTTVEQRIGLLHHVIAVADAIAYAHGRNIIHRDLKPANVIVGDFGETVVIDWGLAKDLTTTDESAVGGGSSRPNRDNDLTSAGSVLGTPAYMAPEQERGEHVDQRADVFAIGSMLWELCSLQKVPPTEPLLRHRILRHAGIDKDLATIIDKALEPDPKRRYPHAGALAADLKAFKSGARIAARNYSLFATLAHWTRRHRTLALSITAVIALAAAGSVLYVQGVATERDRADTALVMVQQERDRAQLAEASLLLGQDPTRAKDLLTSLTLKSPQYALLLSRANQLAATRVIHLPGNVSKLLRHPSTAAISLVTNDGELESVDVDTGTLHVLDHDLRGPATSNGDEWIYARRAFRASSVTIARTSKPAQIIDAGALLADATGQLLTAASHIYALDKHDLYTLEEGSPALVKHGVRSVAGNDRLLMVCTTANELEVIRDGIAERHTRCANNTSLSPMVVAGTDYAALLDVNNLLFVHEDKVLELPTHVSGEYELALSSHGVLALADFSDKTWFVRPGGNQLELGPIHASLPTGVTANDRYAAWGYADGVVIAVDTKSNAMWEFRGHSTHVTSIVIDTDHHRVISIAGPELRVWPLTPSPLILVPHVPCTVYNLARSPDRTQAAIDCYDGTLRVWSSATGSIKEVHHHNGVAFGVAWLRDLACSAGFDGHVMCTSPDGTTQEILSGAERIRWLISSPDYQKLVIATMDGQVKEFDGSLRTLYAHDAPPYRMAFSPDGELLASGADDGSVIVYDFSQQRISNKINAHSARVMSVVWLNHDLWTSSADGTMKHWRYRDHNLTMVDNTREVGSFRFLHRFKNGWSANIDGRILVITLTSFPGRLRFDFDRHVERVEVSPDERYVATTLAGEIIIVDLARDSVASLNIASDGVGYVGFATPESLAISTANGLFTVQLNKLEYINFRSTY